MLIDDHMIWTVKSLFFLSFLCGLSTFNQLLIFIGVNTYPKKLHFLFSFIMYLLYMNVIYNYI